MNSFSKFVNWALRFLFLPVIATTMGYVYVNTKYFKTLNIGLIFFFLLSTTAFICSIKKNINYEFILISIILFGAALRFFWILSLDNKPVSDFAGMYIRSGMFLKGDYSMFHDKNYYARFPHMTVTVLYFALIRHLFANGLLTIKVINALLSTLNIFLIYLISKEVFSSKKIGLYSAYVAAIYPAFITYTAVYCSENIAMPFYLLSIYLFVSAFKNNKKHTYLILSGLILGIGHLFRMVADVVLIAYIMFIFIYIKESIFNKSKATVYIVIAFLVPMLSVNAVLKGLKITQYNLWRGSETKLTSVLRGSNMTTFGRWNMEDAKFIASFDDDKKLEEAIKEKLKERYTQTPLNKLIYFLFRKYSTQWAAGDFAGSYWSQADTKSLIIDLRHNGMMYINLFYLIILIAIYIGLFNKSQFLENPMINLFYIIYCGFGLLYLITESQERYSYIASFLFVILAQTIFRRDELN